MNKGRKSIKEDQVQGVCVLCAKNKQTPRAKSKLGFKRYSSLCSPCSKRKYNIPKKKYRVKKKEYCEACGFIAFDQCQLDVHHIDRNKRNNSDNNLQTLCANCHRLEHMLERKTKTWPSF